MDQRTTPSPSAVGTVLASRYELRSLVGRGGMGEVYEAVDRELERTVAVKVLRPELAADRRFLVRFRREARTVARLSHPGIVAVHDVGESDGRAYIVMAFVAGRTIQDLVGDEGPQPPSKAARLGAEVAEALAHAHDRGIVHRDVSPGNVMVTPSNHAMVLDFGIARAARGSSLSGSPARGTAAYVAPEQARGEASDQRADVYAVGAILHLLLTGRPPRGAEVDLAEPLASVVRRCLARDPAARFASAADLARELRAARVGDAPAATTTAPMPPPARTRVLTPPAPRRRGRRAITVTALAVTILAAGWVAVPALPHALTVEPIVHGPRAVPAPTAFTVQSACNGWFAARADLVWTPGGPSDGYVIWRREPGDATYTLVARIGDWRVSSYTDRGLGLGADYRYAIRAVHGPRLSAPGREVATSTPLLCL